MQALKDRIRAEGVYLGDGILKIDGILNHQMDPNLIKAMGEEIAIRFRHTAPTRILTAEVSGIAPALMAALALNVPVVYARKHKPVTMYGPIFMENAPSHTKGGETNLMVAAEYLPRGERILIVDDFLASGKTLLALARMCREAKCELVGVAVVVEKAFEVGRGELQTKYGVPVEALATITYLDEKHIVFEGEEMPVLEGANGD
ncbi:MAG TPA: xanthine phosphoribosyltransferase [Aggregatilinea sp.]|uniref:xanthine phosphoribosyltransferase n=1 Tax=Aggregatilinea sp. TaxID=2806333 RepID=UPI002BD3D32D|nr:xanthine phosphoribosyltransferase [Aggregatilinea sp.]HML24416.1 xanthine phosphoribosyltransferase [Aggregatilinea sp.]